MSEKLSAKRCRFTHDVALLILQAEKWGFTCALDQVMRTKGEADANAASGAGIANSLHTLGLAVDLLLYKNGVWQTDSAVYKDLGIWWKSFSAWHRWGGDFTTIKDGKVVPKPDGNHFSIEHNGVK